MASGELIADYKMQYKEVIDFLYNSLPVFHKEGGSAYKPGLDNTRILMKSLGNPHLKFRSVHIAGTNGKGSVSHMLCAILMKAGYKTGLYTSPHMLDYRERIRLNGKMISEKHVIDFVNRIKPLCEEIKPSFFEVTMTMAFEYFAEMKVDIAVIETGMGGRLDSTNIINPLVSVITNIGIDHTQFLGKTIPEIATEKAGIIKPGIPVVIGESQIETKPVFDKKAKEKKSALRYADMHYGATIIKRKLHKQVFQIKKTGDKSVRKLVTDLTGNYQKKNIGTVFMAVEILKEAGLKIKRKHIDKALLKVKKVTGLKGRLDIVHKKPLVILDIAHNIDGIREIVSFIQTLHYKKLYVIYGTMKDKDVDSILQLLPREAFYFFTKADLTRSLDYNELYQRSIKHAINGIACPTVKSSYIFAMQMAKKNDMVLITGSNFIVAEALKEIDFQTEKKKKIKKQYRIDTNTRKKQ